MLTVTLTDVNLFQVWTNGRGIVGPNSMAHSEGQLAFGRLSLPQLLSQIIPVGVIRPLATRGPPSRIGLCPPVLVNGKVELGRLIFCTNKVYMPDWNLPLILQTLLQAQLYLAT